MVESGNARRACRHGCGFITRSFALGKHERRCVTTYDRLLEVLQFKKFINVGENDKCWVPDETVWPSGYRVKINGKRAHIVTFEIIHGPVPDGKEVCHTCDIGNCTNPDHVWAGTHLENMQDMHKKNRTGGWGSRPGESTALRAANGWHISDEQRQAMNTAQRGRKHSEATRQKMSETRRGVPLSEAHKQAISDGRRRKE